jgi:RNA polymerase sigma-54 factor
VAIANGNAELHLSSDMMQNLEAMSRDKTSKQNKAAVQYLRSKVDSALWFIEMVRQREQSMLKTIRALVQLQAEYFRTGDPKHLRPMILKDVAEQIGLDISTISRVTSTKYALVDFGIVHLKNLFHQGMAKADGELVTNREISDQIAEMIAAEDKKHPITDQEIADALAENGYVVARRTVAKYREAMHITIAKMRKEM